MIKSGRLLAFLSISLVMNSMAFAQENSDPFSLESSSETRQSLSQKLKIGGAVAIGTGTLLRGVPLFYSWELKNDIKRYEEASRALYGELAGQVPDSVISPGLRELMSVEITASRNNPRYFLELLRKFGPMVAEIDDQEHQFFDRFSKIVFDSTVEKNNKILGDTSWLVATDSIEPGLRFEFQPNDLVDLRRSVQELQLLILRENIFIHVVQSKCEPGTWKSGFELESIAARNRTINSRLYAINQQLNHAFRLINDRIVLPRHTSTSMIVSKVVGELVPSEGFGNAQEASELFERILLDSADNNYGVFDFDALTSLESDSDVIEFFKQNKVSPGETQAFQERLRNILSRGPQQFDEFVQGYDRMPSLKLLRSAYPNQVMNGIRQEITRAIIGDDGHGPRLALSSGAPEGRMLVIRSAEGLDESSTHLKTIQETGKVFGRNRMLNGAAKTLQSVGLAALLVGVGIEWHPETVDTEKDDSSSEAGDSDLGK